MTRSRALTNVDVKEANGSVAYTKVGAMAAPSLRPRLSSTRRLIRRLTKVSVRCARPSPRPIRIRLPALLPDECAAGSGADTITFDPTVFAAPGPHVISLLTALPDITTSMTIQGPAANVLTVENSGAARFRIFTITAGTVTISGMTITNGFTADGPGTGNGVDGGGVFNAGALTLTGVTVSGNRTGKGGDNTTTNPANGGAGGDGGGIINSGTLTISNSTISGNTTGNGGSAIVNTGGEGGGGGGISNGGTLTISNSTISGNTAGNGGFSSSAFGGTGGGGGGIISGGGTLTISNCTINGNTAGAGGSGNVGGFEGLGGGIYGNSGAGITLKSTIVAGNTASSGPNIFGSAVQSDGFNLIQNTSGATINQNPGAGPNITGVSPQLGPLQNNGGPTQTHALALTSPALDKGKSFGLTTDQRGQARPFDNPSIAPAKDGINPPATTLTSAPSRLTRGRSLFHRQTMTWWKRPATQPSRSSARAGRTTRWSVKLR